MIFIFLLLVAITVIWLVEYWRLQSRGSDFQVLAALVKEFYAYMLGSADKGLLHWEYEQIEKKSRTIEKLVAAIDKIDGVKIGTHTLETGNSELIELPVKLTDFYRDRHVYVIGGTGSGKTTLLQNMILQDIFQGKGLAVVGNIGTSHSLVAGSHSSSLAFWTAPMSMASLIFALTSSVRFCA